MVINMNLKKYPKIIEYKEKYYLIHLELSNNEKRYFVLLDKFKCRDCNVFNEDKLKSLNERHLKCVNCKFGKDVFKIHKEYLNLQKKFQKQWLLEFFT